jgi:hypothetical protein
LFEDDFSEWPVIASEGATAALLSMISEGRVSLSLHLRFFRSDEPTRAIELLFQVDFETSIQDMRELLSEGLRDTKKIGSLPFVLSLSRQRILNEHLTDISTLLLPLCQHSRRGSRVRPPRSHHPSSLSADSRPLLRPTNHARDCPSHYQRARTGNAPLADGRLLPGRRGREKLEVLCRRIGRRWGERAELDGHQGEWNSYEISHLIAMTETD